MIILEGIHALNPKLTEHIPDKYKYKIYVSALTTILIDDHSWIPTTDNRLIVELYEIIIIGVIQHKKQFHDGR